MIQRILNFTIRKDITKKNKSINHAAFVRSIPFGTKIPYLAKYHKKKLIASILALVIIYTYDLQKRIITFDLSHLQVHSFYTFSDELCVLDVCGRKKNTKYYFIAKLRWG